MHYIQLLRGEPSSEQSKVGPLRLVVVRLDERRVGAGRNWRCTRYQEVGEGVTIQMLQEGTDGVRDTRRWAQG